MRRLKAAPRTDRGYVLVSGGRPYSAKQVGLLAEEIELGRSVDRADYTGGMTVARYIQGLRTSARVCVRLRVANIIMASSFTASEFRDAASTLTGAARERRKWITHQQGLVDQFLAGPDQYRVRIGGLVDVCKRVDADIAAFPACAILHRDSAEREAIEKDLAVLPWVAAGRLTVPHRRCRLLAELPGEDAALFGEGIEAARVRFRLAPRGACHSLRRNAVGIAISRGITEFRDSVETVSDAGVRDQRLPWLLVDVGHHQYGDRHVRQTLRTTCASWREKGAGGMPLASLSYWHYADSSPTSGTSHVIDADGKRVPRARRELVPVAGLESHDWIDIYDLLLELPNPR
jgi:hypothetical protein